MFIKLITGWHMCCCWFCCIQCHWARSLLIGPRWRVSPPDSEPGLLTNWASCLNAAPRLGQCMPYPCPSEPVAWEWGSARPGHINTASLQGCRIPQCRGGRGSFCDSLEGSEMELERHTYLAFLDLDHSLPVLVEPEPNGSRKGVDWVHSGLVLVCLGSDWTGPNARCWLFACIWAGESGMDLIGWVLEHVTCLLFSVEPIGICHRPTHPTN